MLTRPTGPAGQPAVGGGRARGAGRDGAGGARPARWRGGYDWLGGIFAIEAAVAGLVIVFVRTPDLYTLPPPGPRRPCSHAGVDPSAGITGLRTAALAGEPPNLAKVGLSHLRHRPYRVVLDELGEPVHGERVDQGL